MLHEHRESFLARMHSAEDRPLAIERMVASDHQGVHVAGIREKALKLW